MVEERRDNVAVEPVHIREFFRAREDSEVGSFLLQGVYDAAMLVSACRCK